MGPLLRLSRAGMAGPLLALAAALLAVCCGKPAATHSVVTAAPASSGCPPWRGGSAAEGRHPAVRGRQLIQRQHSGEVWSLLGLAGAMVGTGGDDNTVRIWDLGTGMLVQVLRERQLIGPGPSGNSVIVEGYDRAMSDWSEVSIGDGRVVDGADRTAGGAAVPSPSTPDAAPPPRALARISGSGTARWVGVDAAERQLVWFDEQRRLRGRLATPVEPNSHDLQLVDRITVRANFWAQGERLVGELDPDGYGPEPASIVVWQPHSTDLAQPERVLPLPNGGTHLLALERSGRVALIYSSQRGAPSELRAVELDHGATGNGSSAAANLGTRLFELQAPHYRTQLAVAPTGDRIALVDGRALAVYDLSTGTVVWRVRAEDRVVRRAPSSPQPWHQRVSSEPHLFEDVAFTGDGRFVAVRSRLGVHAYHADSGRYRGELGARPRAIAAAPRFASNDSLVVAAGSHLQQWNVAEGTLQSTAEVPLYFGRAECTLANLLRWCPFSYAEAYHPLPAGDLLRVRQVAQLSGTVSARYPGFGLTACQRSVSDPKTGEAQAVAGIPIVFERTTGLKPVPAPRTAQIPPLSRWPPKRGSRGLLCSPIRLDFFHIGQQVDAAGGRIVGQVLGQNRGAIFDLTSRAITELEGDGEPLSWRAGGTLISGRLRHDIAKHGDALWRADGRLVWQAVELRDRLTAVRSDGARAAVGRHRGAAGPAELVIVDLRDGTELSRVTLPEPCQLSSHGLASYWPAASDALYCGTSSGALLRIVDGRVDRASDAGGDEIRALVPSPDGRRLVTWSIDGLLRLWEPERLELLASFIEFDDGEWLTFTSDGTYGGSPEAAERVAWAFDGRAPSAGGASRGPPEVFRFEQFAASFRRPDRIAKRLAGEAVAAPPLRKPPSASLLRSAVGEDGLARVRAEFSSPGRVDWVRLFVEGRMLAQQAVCSPQGEVELDVPLVRGTNRLTAVAFDAAGLTSNPAQVDLVSAAGQRPDLYMVTVGVSRYPHLAASLQLEAADDDARALVSAFQSQTGPGRTYRQLHAQTLLDAAATVEAIDGAVAALSRMRAQDVAVVFFAGHGIKPGADEEMVFLTTATASTKARDVRTAGYGWNRLGDRLAALPGRVLVLLDACHSGHVTRDWVVPNEALAQSLSAGGRAGAVVFAASKGRQVSFEASGTRGLELARVDPALERIGRRDEPHGLFTAALLASLATGSTDRNGDGAVQLSELIDEVTMRVIHVTGGQQTPWVARRELFGDFRISTPARR